MFTTPLILVASQQQLPALTESMKKDLDLVAQQFPRPERPTSQALTVFKEEMRDLHTTAQASAVLHKHLGLFVSCLNKLDDLKYPHSDHRLSKEELKNHPITKSCDIVQQRVSCCFNEHRQQVTKCQPLNEVLPDSSGIVDLWTLYGTLSGSRKLHSRYKKRETDPCCSFPRELTIASTKTNHSLMSMANILFHLAEHAKTEMRWSKEQAESLTQFLHPQLKIIMDRLEQPDPVSQPELEQYQTKLGTVNEITSATSDAMDSAVQYEEALMALIQTNYNDRDYPTLIECSDTLADINKKVKGLRDKLLPDDGLDPSDFIPKSSILVGLSNNWATYNALAPKVAGRNATDIAAILASVRTQEDIDRQMAQITGSEKVPAHWISELCMKLSMAIRDETTWAAEQSNANEDHCQNANKEKSDA